jgi:hypothetical protein
MTDLEDEDADLTDERPVMLGDGDCFVVDVDYLDPSVEYEGIRAIQLREGGLYILIGSPPHWVNAEGEIKAKPAVMRRIQ